MLVQIKIDGKDCTANTIMPIKWNALLDERLDEGRLSVRRTNTKMYPIGAQVKITDGTTTKDFIVSADESTELPTGSGYYNHELSIIEPTKLLEGIIVETLTFTNNLGRNYEVDKIVSPLEGSTNSIEEVEVTCKENYLTPITTGVLHVFSIKEMFTFDEFQAFYVSSGETIKVHVTGDNFNEGFTSDIFSDTSKSINVNLNKVGYYNIDYEFSWSERRNGAVYRSHYWFGINVVPQRQSALPKWTIRAVIDRVLNLAEPLLETDSPRFKLDTQKDPIKGISQAEEFDKILAPEFAFTQKTLKEILDQIGGFIHGIPRLIADENGEFNTIHFDMLGGTEEALISSENLPYITETLSQNIEDYASEIDSTTDNLVNSLDSAEGAITEPYAGGFKSVRSEESYARIEEGNMVISTSLPIYSIQKLEVIDPANNVGDITAYVFEGAEYGRLSSFDGKYPTSKAFAIYYNLGKNNIKGLAYKSPNIFGGAQSNYAITNIIKAVTRHDIDDKFWGNEIKGEYSMLAFRITYTPVFSARILQHKPYVEKGALNRALVYNQGANLIEARYYGENMRGTIARMGNAELTRTYRTKSLTYIPKIGQTFNYHDDDYYISSVVVAVYAEFIDFTVGMSKDFNRLSQYIGINSEWRAYEVSERKAYKRDIIYRDYCVVGNDIPAEMPVLLTSGGRRYIGNIFSQTIDGDYDRYYSKPITLAKVTTYDEQNEPRTVTLPVVSTAFGNAMVFSFGMEDNYSAGAKSVPQDPNNSVTGYWQTDVPYVDYYGRVKSMAFTLGATGESLSFGSAATFELPQGNQYGSENIPPIRTPDGNNLKIDKNGSEILRFNYQLEFVSNRKDIIIGPALARNCLLVTTRQSDENNNAIHASAVYVVNKKIGKFDTAIDLSSATMIADYSNTPPSVWSIIVLGTFVPNVSGKAWVIADKSNGAILLAQNKDIVKDKVLVLPHMTFTHKLP